MTSLMEAGGGGQRRIWQKRPQKGELSFHGKIKSSGGEACSHRILVPKMEYMTKSRF